MTGGLSGRQPVGQAACSVHTLSILFACSRASLMGVHDKWRRIRQCQNQTVTNSDGDGDGDGSASAQCCVEVEPWNWLSMGLGPGRASRNVFRNSTITTVRFIYEYKRIVCSVLLLTRSNDNISSDANVLKLHELKSQRFNINANFLF